MSIPDETNTQNNTEIITDRDMSMPDENNIEIIDNTKIITKPDTETDTTTSVDTDTQTKMSHENIELSPTTIAEIDRIFSSAAYHMGDFVTEYRQLREKLYSTIQSAPTPSVPRPSSTSSPNSSALASASASPKPAPGREPAEREPAESTPASARSSARMLHPLTKKDLNTLLLLLLCLTTKSLLKREGYLESKVEELTLELDGQMRIKDDWVLVHRTAIPVNLGAGEEWKGGRGRGIGKGWFRGKGKK